MTRFITTAIFNGTSISYAIPGNDVDSVMMRVRRVKALRDATLFMFYNRKTAKLSDVRVN